MLQTRMIAMLAVAAILASGLIFATPALAVSNNTNHCTNGKGGDDSNPNSCPVSGGGGGSTQVLTTINLSSDVSTVTSNTDVVTFTATALDQNGSAISGVVLTDLLNGTATTTVATTNASGVVTFQLSFGGTTSVQVQNGTVASNTIVITFNATNGSGSGTGTGDNGTGTGTGGNTTGTGGGTGDNGTGTGTGGNTTGTGGTGDNGTGTGTGGTGGTGGNTTGTGGTGDNGTGTGIGDNSTGTGGTGGGSGGNQTGTGGTGDNSTGTGGSNGGAGNDTGGSGNSNHGKGKHRVDYTDALVLVSAYNKLGLNQTSIPEATGDFYVLSNGPLGINLESVLLSEDVAGFVGNSQLDNGQILWVLENYHTLYVIGLH